MSTYTECKEMEKELEEMRKQYNEENPPCTNENCAFYKNAHENNCSYHYYHADECGDYED